LRYIRPDKRTTGNGVVSFITVASMTGIALGVAALIIVLCVLNGFRSEVRDRMLSVLAHIEVLSPRGIMPNWRRTADESLQSHRYRAPCHMSMLRYCSCAVATLRESQCAASIHNSNL
jgi:lipoprotein-releasing system permease protein